MRHHKPKLTLTATPAIAPCTDIISAAKQCSCSTRPEGKWLADDLFDRIKPFLTCVGVIASVAVK